MRIVCVLLLMSGILSTSYAQDIDKIKRDAESNKREKEFEERGYTSSAPSKKKASSVYNSSSSSKFGFLELFPLVVEGFKELQVEMLDKKEEVREMVSIEAIVDANISGNGQAYLFRPRLRANWGVFSVESRIYNLVARDSNGRYGRFSYIDFQPIMINVFAKQAFKFRAGTGLSYENYTHTVYNEHTLQMEVVPVPALVIKLEGRWAIDYGTMMYVRQEAIINIDYKVKEAGHWLFYAGLNASYNNLYQDNEFWVFGPTFRVRLQ